jgi:hypothetical protein
LTPWYGIFQKGVLTGDIASARYWQSGGAQTDPAGGNETRPKNINVNWIIKAKHLLALAP